MSKALHELVLGDLHSRKSGWEDKQRTFYDMRHDGIRRRNKPLPDSADLHFPLVDGMIEKLKPFYFAQVWGQELLANFIALEAGAEPHAAAAAQWFDYQVKHRTNFFRENLALDDLMLMSGVGVLKLWWDLDEKALAFDAVDPLFFIVPEGTDDLEKADRLTHVRTMTVGQYERDWRYDHAAEVIAQIKGRGRTSAGDVDSGGKGEAKYSREGITHTERPDEIVLWETFEHVGGKRWRVSTYAPSAPDVPVRAPFLLPGEYLGCPFVEFPAEIKDKGYYASRGVTEKSGQFELYLCRVWNEKADSMTWLSRPLLSAGASSQAALNNIRLVPGQILPGDIKRIDMGQVPFDFDNEMLRTREVAQEHAAMPDLGLGRQSSLQGKKTAKEVEVTATLMQQSTDLRSYIKRWAMAQVYRKAWSLLARYARDQLAYVFDDTAAELPADALRARFLVTPEGAPDNWNKPLRQQRAQQRAQLYNGNPYVDQAELTKHVLEEDDPRLRRRLFRDPQNKAASQAEDQAHELVILREGWPAVVTPADDDNVHLQTIYGWGLKVRATGEVVPPLGIQRVMQHAAQHMQQLAQKDKAAAARWQQAFTQFAQAMGSGPAQAGAGAPQPMPGGAPAGVSPAAGATGTEGLL